MIIKYMPAEGEPQLFDAGRMRASEIQIIERTADRSWPAIKEEMGLGNVNAMRVVAWVIKKRTEPSLRFGDFDPWDDELRVMLDAKETRAYAERLLAKYGDNPEDLADAFDELRDASFDREACEAAIADVMAPKSPDAPEAEPQPEESPASPSGT
ncbi:hypothetical protein [Streptomyces caniscabiei]|uniref:Phage protein n=1 Tax=Streptomyces caniscabiei TaxID=2746961 RepID=A0ABU4MIR6_9ACTN|nr:hypothetical protein [Streptomyces caniscabiei]MBE4790920.1 hypothetical protein [Streptomyces caniscabiei]MDX2953348.1 hypothetical protein [Streptomyces caniscabiei]MDX2987315.1 hypothetical protein [Streptomyces caniscabiei]MDX3009548.1 hypothetical protein [Streptomyces caniscabiei]MDX3037193.1 hypothetical protein [Streptomyces caniscabiei]